MPSIQDGIGFVAFTHLRIETWGTRHSAWNIPKVRLSRIAYTLAMGLPYLTVLGVYRPIISTETWQEQWQVTGDDDQTKEHLDKLVLIGAIVEGLDEPFDMSKFGQMQPDHPDDPATCRSDTMRPYCQQTAKR